MKTLKLTQDETFQVIFNRACDEANEITKDMEPHPFNCGFAWIEFDKRSAFGKWLSKTHCGDRKWFHSQANTQDKSINSQWIGSFLEVIKKEFPEFKYKTFSRLD